MGILSKLNQRDQDIKSISGLLKCYREFNNNILIFLSLIQDDLDENEEYSLDAEDIKKFHIELNKAYNRINSIFESEE